MIKTTIICFAVAVIVSSFVGILIARGAKKKMISKDEKEVG